MIDPASKTGLPLPATTGTRPISGVPAPDSVDGGSVARGARFQSLLEELELRSQAIARKAEGPMSAQSLPTAVEDARASLEDALALSQSLLEAFRQSTAQAGGGKADHS
ncbi:MAG TPA: hypothetical protein VK843_20030 [Planctomycetota bacterium]|nr:hypothetical protein [Planctomycetota bacterium]